MKSLRRLPASLQNAFLLVASSGKPLLALVVGLIVATAILVAVELLLVRSIIDELAAGNPAMGGLIAFGAVAAMRRLIAAVLHETRWLISERVDQTVMRDVLQVATDASYEKFELPDFQDHLSRAIQAAQHQVWAASDGLLRLLRSATTLIALGSVMIAIVPEFVLPFSVAAGGLGVVTSIKSQMSYAFEYHDTAQDRERRYLRDALVSRSEGREMRLFGTASQLRDRHDALLGTRLFNLRKLLRRRLVAELFSAVALSAVLAGCLVYIGRQVANEDIEFGAAAVAALTAYQLLGTLSGLFTGSGTLLEASYHVDDLQAFLSQPKPPRRAVRTSRPNRIVLSNVSYTYPESASPALHDISLDLRAGEVVAVVGENGSGKSTLARLFLGLYAPTTGSAVVVDVDGSSHQIDGPLASQASATFQDFARYELTLLENISLGRSHQDAIEENRVTSLLASVKLTEAVRRLPEGLNTRLGRRFAKGQDLSVGQWQRLALARAMANSEATFVVLDEPTSALDPTMENLMFDEVRQNFPGKGVLLISHRLASLHQADRIVVLDAGEIAEIGSHTELVRQNGLYAAMHRRQASRFIDTPRRQG